MGKKRKLSRIDYVGLNGNEGLHYPKPKARKSTPSSAGNTDYRDTGRKCHALENKYNRSKDKVDLYAELEDYYNYEKEENLQEEIEASNETEGC